MTSQYFPMKVCVAKQLTVCSGKIQGYFLADERDVCFMCVWRSCWCIESAREPLVHYIHKNHPWQFMGKLGLHIHMRAFCLIKNDFVRLLGKKQDRKVGAFLSVLSHKNRSHHENPPHRPRCVRMLVCVLYSSIFMSWELQTKLQAY